MPRIPTVSRTLTLTYATVLCVDIENETVVRRDVTLARTFKNDNTLMRAAQGVLNDDNLRVSHVVTSTKARVTLTMTEQDFICAAKKSVLWQEEQQIPNKK